MKKVSIYIDGNNFYHGLRYLYGKDKSLKKFNFERFVKYLVNGRTINNIFYYNAQLDETKNKEKFESQEEFFNNLKKIPNFNLILCSLLKRRVKGTDNYYYVLKEDDIHMAVDMVEGACDNNFDVAILISGDGDFVPAVNAVKRRDKQIENIYFQNSSSRKLKEYCDTSFELNKKILDNFFD